MRIASALALSLDPTHEHVVDMLTYPQTLRVRFYGLFELSREMRPQLLNPASGTTSLSHGNTKHEIPLMPGHLELVNDRYRPSWCKRDH